MVPFEIPNADKIIELAYKFTLADGFKHHMKLLKGEDVDPSILANWLLAKIPFPIKYLLGLCLSKFSPGLSLGFKNGPISAMQLQDLLAERKCAIKAVVKEWKELNLDVVIGPAFPHPAVPSHMPTRLLPSGTYTGIYNVLDFPAGVVPIRYATSQDEADMESYPTHGNPLLKMIKSSMKGMEGLPLSVQVIGLPYHDECILSVMKMLEKSNRI